MFEILPKIEGQLLHIQNCFCSVYVDTNLQSHTYSMY